MNIAKNSLPLLAASLLFATARWTCGADPAAAAAHGNKGHELSQAAKYDEAIVEYTKAIELKAIELGPKNELGYLERGRTELGQNQFDTALTDLTKAIELNPNDMVAYERRGQVYHSLRKWDE